MIVMVLMAVVVMVLMIMGVVMGCPELRHQFIHKRLLSLDHLQNLIPGNLIPGSCDNGCSRIQLPDLLYTQLQLLRFCILGTAQYYSSGILNLIVKKLAKGFHLLGGFHCIDNRHQRVQLHAVVFFLHLFHRSYHIGKLPDAGGFNENPVRMIHFNHFPETSVKISYQGTADTAGIQFPDLYAGILQKSSVNTNFPIFIFHQNNLLILKHFFQHFLDQCGFTCPQKSGNNINFDHFQFLLSIIK